MKIAGIEILLLTIIVPALIYRVVNRKYFMVFMIAIEILVIGLTMVCIYDIDNAILTLKQSLVAVEDV